MLKFFRFHPHLCSLCFLALLVLAVLADVLFFDTDKVASAAGTDLFHQFTHWRQFAFFELRRGNLPLWNPHIYAGVPFMAGFQSALFYPLNWMHLLLPLKTAINWTVALHVFLMGGCMYAWLVYRKLNPLAAVLGAVMAMFSGPYFLHIYAGHLSDLTTMVWVPLIFLSIDGLARTLTQVQPSIRSIFLWMGLGAGSVALQILAGHVQWAYYTGIAAGLYALAQLWRHQQPFKLIGFFVIFYVFGGLLAALQVLPGLEASQESARSAGVPYLFAAMFSFPPENLLTSIAPLFFGHISAYWGRCFLWEMSLFVSVSGCVLALFSYAGMQRKDFFIALFMMGILFWLALGSRTPLFKVLYSYLPGFNAFRGTSKFTFHLILFLILLAAAGYDQLTRNAEISRKFLIALVAGGLLAGLLGCLIYLDSRQGGSSSYWSALLEFIQQSQEAKQPPEFYQNPNQIVQSGRDAAFGLSAAGATLLMIAGLLVARRKSTAGLYGVALLVLTEMLIFAESNQVSTPFTLTVTPSIQQILGSDPGDYRILNLYRSVHGVPVYSNEAMSGNWEALWGNDPLVSRRYAEMMAASQGKHPDYASQLLSFQMYNKFLAMFRTRYVLTGNQEDNFKYQKVGNHLPRFLFLHDYKLIRERNQTLKYMANDAFDPRQVVILENRPGLEVNAASANENVRIVDESTDHCTLDVDMSENGVLLVTDAYSKNWQATGDGVRYEVVPANYAMLAVVIPKGRHRIRLEYVSSAFYAGGVVSAITIGIYLAVMVFSWMRPYGSSHKSGSLDSSASHAANHTLA